MLVVHALGIQCEKSLALAGALGSADGLLGNCKIWHSKIKWFWKPEGAISNAVGSMSSGKRGEDGFGTLRRR